MKRILVVAAFAVAGFVIGYGAIASAWPVHGRNAYRGYFQNTYDDQGAEVLPPNCSGAYRYWNGNSWCNAIPNTVNSAASFVGFIEDRANGGYNSQTTTGAQFIIHTIIGTPDGARSRPPTAQQYQTFRDAIYGSEAAGRINWATNYNFNINSYWQGASSGPNPQDDAFYNDTGNGQAIVIYNNTGNPYVIRRECANPVGIGSVSSVSEWYMEGRTTATNETSAARGSNPFPGDQIRFRHYVRNRGPTATGQEIWFAILDHPSGDTLQGGLPSGYYGPGPEKLVDSDEVITIPISASTGTQYCRKVLYDPADSWGARRGVGAPACVTVVAPYNLNPSINVQINGGSVTGNLAEPGDTITFTYAVNNADNGASSGTNCTIYGLTRNNYHTIPSPVDTTSDPGFVQPTHGCPRSFPGNTNTTLVTETVPAASVVANRSICRTLVVNPASPTVGARPVEACAYVAAKPYTRVYGGDISAGGGVETAPNTCSANTGAAIIGWNKRAGGAYGGAGAQFAAYAMSAIFDAATSLSASAGAPTGLSFANSGANAANGNFGGSFGTAPCIPDYYSARPAAPAPLPSCIGTSLASGSYGNTGTSNVTLCGGTVQPGVKATLYVNGSLYISSNIMYGSSGSWSSATVPNLRIIVRGNIFIGKDVTQLDGLYVAQPNGSSGIIHTCTLPATPFASVPDTQIASQCANKLTVNGSFAARQLKLQRTAGTLRQSNAGESSASSNIAEVFNYSPALWITQPSDDPGTAIYDSINSLPPVL